MNKTIFSGKILAKVRSSAIRYAQIAAKSKCSGNSFLECISIFTGYESFEEHISCAGHLDKVISLAERNLRSEQKMAREFRNRYDFSRHIELHNLIKYLKEKRRKLQTHCA